MKATTEIELELNNGEDWTESKLKFSLFIWSFCCSVIQIVDKNIVFAGTKQLALSAALKTFSVILVVRDSLYFTDTALNAANSGVGTQLCQWPLNFN